MALRVAARPSKSPVRQRPRGLDELFSPLRRGELQALAKALALPATAANAVLAESLQDRLGEDAEREAVRAAFALIDKNGDGALSRIEVIQACKKHPSVRALLSLPASIRQEDGTRDSFEQIYQQLDVDDSKSVTLEEFEQFFFSPLAAPTGSSAAARRKPPTAGVFWDAAALVAGAAIGLAFLLLSYRFSLLQLQA